MSFHFFDFFFSETGPLIDPEFTESQIHLSPPPQCQDCKNTPIFNFCVGSRTESQFPHVTN